MYKYQHSIKRLLKNKLDPHCVLTSGEISYNQLKKHLPKLNIVNIGKLFQKNIYKPKTFNYFNLNSKIIICVLPEGIIEETLKLLNFSLSCVVKNKNLHFIWRFHPLTDFEKIKEVMNINENLPKNILLSKKSLEHDLKNSNMALYRGSSSNIRMNIILIL